MNGSTIAAAVQAVTGKWSKQRKAEQRHASAQARRYEAMTRTRRVSIKEAAGKCIVEAYNKASDGGKWPAKARQIMYAIRPLVLELTGGKFWSHSSNFTQGFLPEFVRDHPDVTANWDVIYDARGHLREPHTDLVVPLGTLEVRNYLADIEHHEPNLWSGANVEVDSAKWKTKGPEHCFGALLFVEKEGFDELFKRAKLAERYDIAIMSTKGMSVTACRSLADELCGRYDIPLFVVRDFDKSGFSISGTLQRDTARYEFQNHIEVADFGLRLEDVSEWRLESEPVTYKSDPTWNLRENGATKQEIDFLYDDSNYVYRAGKRVELNAFSSGNLLKWIEGKLQQHGVKKVVPGDDVLETAYRRHLEHRLLEEKLEEIAGDDVLDKVHERAQAVAVPKRLVKQIEKLLKEKPEITWDKAIHALALKAKVDEEEDDDDE